MISARRRRGRRPGPTQWSLKVVSRNILLGWRYVLALYCHPRECDAFPRREAETGGAPSILGVLHRQRVSCSRSASLRRGAGRSCVGALTDSRLGVSASPHIRATSRRRARDSTASSRHCVRRATVVTVMSVRAKLFACGEQVLRALLIVIPEHRMSAQEVSHHVQIHHSCVRACTGASIEREGRVWGGGGRNVRCVLAFCFF